MRRTLLAMLAAIVTVLAVPTGAAGAAEGTVIINGRHYDDPRGCFNVRTESVVENLTDRPLGLHRGHGCHRGSRYDSLNTFTGMRVAEGRSLSVS